MKKVIVIFILVIFVMSIAVVNIFGKPIELSETNVYIKTIEIDYLSIGIGEDEIKLTDPTTMMPVVENGETILIPTYTFTFVPAPEGQEYTTDPYNMAENPNNIFIKLKYTTTSLNPDVEPDNPNLNIISTNVQEVTEDMVIGKSYYLVGDESILDNSNTIVFHKMGRVDITFSGADGFNSKLRIRIIAMPQQ